MIRAKVIGKDNVGWSIDKDRAHFLSFLQEIPDVKVVESMWKADVFIFVWLDRVIRPHYILVRLLRTCFKKKIVAWITNDVTQDRTFDSKRWPVDLFISPSKRTSAFLSTQNLQHVEIPFYVSPKTYRKLPYERRELAEKLGLEWKMLEGKFLIGSFQRDSLGDDLSKPKWQKDPEFFVQIVKKIPKEKILIILVGPRRHYLVRRLGEEGIPFVFVGDTTHHTNMTDDMFANNLPEETMNLAYNLTDLNLVTSKSEGGPKAVLEASLAQTLVMSTDVGNAPEFLHPDLIYRSADEAARRIIGFLENPASAEKYLQHDFIRASVAMERENYKNRIAAALASV